MRKLYFVLISVMICLLPTPVYAADDTVDKTICKLAVGYQDVDEIQADLLAAAKREVINELFGEMIVASTAVENFVVTSDQIRTSSIGFVRVDGNAEFFNGKGFAEVCVTIQAYVTDEDMAQFNPEKLEKKYCDADKDMTTAQLIAYVKEEAVIQSLVEYNPKLKGADKESLLQLVQKVSYSASGFISDTQTYCATFKGDVVPVEVMAFLETQQDIDGEGGDNSMPGFKSGTYRVKTSDGYTSTWTLEIADDKITGFSRWDGISGETRMTGVISGNKVIIQRDWCSEDSDLAECSQTFSGSLTDNVVTGLIVGTGISGNVSWTLYLE